MIVRDGALKGRKSPRFSGREVMLNSFYFDALDYDGKGAYNAILSALQNGDRECTIEAQDQRSAERVWKAVVFDNPDIINYPGLVCSGSFAGEQFTFSLDYGDVDAALYERRLGALRDEIEAALPPGASDLKVFEVIYEKLASKIEYGYDEWDEFCSIPRGEMQRIAGFLTENNKIFTAYGAVTESHAVCQGIAKLFKILCNGFGLQCAVAEAYMGSTIPENHLADHMLNVIELDGRRAFVDVTMGLSEGTMVRYDSFMVSRARLGKMFSVEFDFDCENEDMDWFSRRGLAFDDFGKLRRYITEHISDGRELRLRYDGDISDDELSEAVAEIGQMSCPEWLRLELFNPRGGCCNGIFKDDTEE